MNEESTEIKAIQRTAYIPRLYDNRDNMICNRKYYFVHKIVLDYWKGTRTFFKYVIIKIIYFIGSHS